MSQSIYVNSNLWYIDQNIKLKIKLGIYQNILIFFNDNDILFLSEMKLDFREIALSHIQNKGRIGHENIPSPVIE